MTKLLDDYECCGEVGITSEEVTSDDDEPATQCASAVAAPGLPSSSLVFMGQCDWISALCNSI